MFLLKGFQSALSMPAKSLQKSSDIEDCEPLTSAIKMETEEKEIVGHNADDDLANANEDLESELPCKYSVGELAWARVGTAPFWPCTYTYDPDLKIHSYISRAQAGGLSRSHRQV